MIRTSMTKIQGGQPASVENLRDFAQAAAPGKGFEALRKYGHDFSAKPDTARVFVAMQLIYLGLWPKDMSTYNAARSPRSTFTSPERFAMFGALWDTPTRAALLKFLKVGSRERMQLLRTQMVGEPEQPFSLQMVGRDLVAQAADIGSEESDLWTSILMGRPGGLVRAVDDFFSYAGRPSGGLLEQTRDIARNSVPLLFTSDSRSSLARILRLRQEDLAQC